MGKAARNQRRAERHEVESAMRQEAMFDEWGRVVRQVVAGSPAGVLEAAALLQRLIDQQRDAAVIELARSGVPWSRIGQTLGVSGQAVSKRYGGRL